MRRMAVLAAAVVVAAGSTVGVAAAQGRTPAGGHARTHTQTFTVVERAVSDTAVDTGPKGDSLGDLLAFNNPIYNAANTVRIGRDNGSCIRTKVGAAFECSWTLILDGGSLVVQGPFYDTRDSTLAITGGTGRFARAHGSMRLHARNAAGTAYDFTYHVIG